MPAPTSPTAVDRADLLADGAEAAAAFGPVVRFADLPWSAQPIAASENAKVGPAACFDGLYRVPGEGDVALVRTFELTMPFPAASGLLAIEGADAKSLTINGENVAVEATATPGRAWAHLWAHLVSGENTLRITVRGGSTIAVSLQLRDLDANGDARSWSIPTAEWHCEAGLLERVGEAPDEPLFDRPRRSVELLKRLSIDAPPKRATLAIIGPALHEATLNGRPVTDRLLEPGWTDYRKRLTLCEYDVTDLLAGGGEIELSITLGNGWYSGGMGWQHLGRFCEADAPLWTSARLLLEQADGGTAAIATDDTWQWRPSATAFDSIYDGETRGPAADDWRPVRVLDPVDALVTRPALAPIRDIETLAPVAVTKRAAGRFVIDFGQNHTGVCEVDITGVAEGTELRLRHAEVVDDAGELEVIFLRTARATDRLTVEPNQATWRPRFTYHGYRYAELSGVPDDWSEADVRRRVVSRVMHTELPDAGSFDCSDKTLNKIWLATRWGLRSNVHSVITDCPQRDERLGWTGDVQFIAATAPWYFDVSDAYRKYLLDILDAQHDDGGIPYVVPQTVVNEVSMAWADVIAALPMAVWTHYGDRDLLEMAYPALTRWMAYLDAHETDGRVSVGTFGDWVPVVESPPQLVAQAWSSYAAELACRIARIVGKNRDADKFAEAAKRRAARFHQDHFDAAAGRYAPDTQTAQVLPLAFGLVPEKHVASVQKALVDNVRRHGNKLSTGFCGTPLLLHCLSDAGADVEALDAIRTTEKPSLGYMIAQGGTTIWERWDSDTNAPDMNSRNHFAFGSMTRWLFEHLAGIHLDRAADGRLTITLSPRPMDPLTHVEVRRALPEGELRVRWERDGGEFRVSGQMPNGVTGWLAWPGGDAASVAAGAFAKSGAV